MDFLDHPGKEGHLVRRETWVCRGTGGPRGSKAWWELQVTRAGQGTWDPKDNQGKLEIGGWSVSRAFQGKWGRMVIGD